MSLPKTCDFVWQIYTILETFQHGVYDSLYTEIIPTYFRKRGKKRKGKLFSYESALSILITKTQKAVIVQIVDNWALIWRDVIKQSQALTMNEKCFFLLCANNNML